MNTVKSVYYGWATLIVAGGGAYYFAKKSINADRAAKAAADRQKRIQHAQLEEQYLHKPQNPSSLPPPSSSLSPNPSSSNPTANQVGGGGREREDKDWEKGFEEANDPSQEASHDPAPTRHAPVDEAQKAREKSKYEASDVFRSRKGDRFS
ncbi:hypothetical protein BCR34DRAFT_607264 [Clohesyomyces aquaticus]|uniref:Uncharacterized protein n=1 Tax=Clohesyomyces aquaticus TaxID=1231657 RepID=A0A1Y1YI93_9PLEO|nr:hypothetical protein BCR34DRAFT_607264 [Clohesyomyces aquaticus]